MPDQSPETPLPRVPSRSLPRLFLLALAVLLARTAFVDLWQRYVFLPTLGPGLPQAFPSEALQFVSSAGSFLFSPLLLFFAFYVAGKGLDLASGWESITGSAFLAGAVAAVLGIFLSLVIYLGGDLPSYSGALASEFGNGWNLGSLVLSCLAGGLYTAFVAVAAIFYAGYRAKSRPAPTEKEEGPLQTPSGPGNGGLQVGSDFERSSTALS